MTSLSNELAAQAEDVKLLVAEADAAAMTSITKSLEAGALLIAAKAGCGHGNWLPFLKRAGVQERKAQRLMKLAKSGMTSDAVSEIGGVTAALEFVALNDRIEANLDAAYSALRYGQHPAPSFWGHLAQAREDIETLAGDLPEAMRGPLISVRTPEEEAAQILSALGIQAAA